MKSIGDAVGKGYVQRIRLTRVIYRRLMLALPARASAVHRTGSGLSRIIRCRAGVGIAFPCFLDGYERLLCVGAAPVVGNTNVL